MQMILMHYDAEITEKWHIARKVSKSGLSVVVELYCSRKGDEIEQIPVRCLKDLAVCSQCAKEAEEIG